MAKNRSTVYLGYEDEEITAKHVALLNSNVNKIGGTADWPSGEIKVPPCPLCNTVRPLIVQLYGPLEQSQFHRSLYIFACLNPACSPNSKSWVCIRTQHLEHSALSREELIQAITPPPGSKQAGKMKKNKQAQKQPVTWCSGADDWGGCDDAASTVDTKLGGIGAGSCEDMDTGADDFNSRNEENGNVIMAKNDNNGLACGPPPQRHLLALNSDEEDDEDIADNGREEEDDEDESNSMENELVCGFGQLDMVGNNKPSENNSAAMMAAVDREEEDPNANCAAAGAHGDMLMGVCVGGSATATATICAEIEEAETDVVFVETPQKPERDLIALLKHTPSSAAVGPLAKITDLTIKPFFMAVDVEQRGRRHPEQEYYGGALHSADHIRELYQEYKRQDDAVHSPTDAEGISGGGGAAIHQAGGDEQESYEKAVPAHGDVIFHQFVTTLHENPGQILRYSRDTLPLLISHLNEPLPKCPNCGGESICEVQILPTLIPRLRLLQNGEPAPIEYGNVLVFTCLQSCWDTPDKMRYERVIVQAEQE